MSYSNPSRWIGFHRCVGYTKTGGKDQRNEGRINNNIQISNKLETPDEMGNIKWHCAQMCATIIGFLRTLEMKEECAYTHRLRYIKSPTKKSDRTRLLHNDVH